MMACRWGQALLSFYMVAHALNYCWVWVEVPVQVVVLLGCCCWVQVSLGWRDETAAASTAGLVM
jgi:hypothetical protein